MQIDYNRPTRIQPLMAATGDATSGDPNTMRGLENDELDAALFSGAVVSRVESDVWRRWTHTRTDQREVVAR